MSWWDDVVDAVANVVEDAANVVGDVVADAVETTGNAVQDGLNAAVNAWPGVPSAVTSWLGGIVAGVTNLIGATVKAVFGIVGGVIGGFVRVLGGIVGWDSRLVKNGWVDIVSSILGGVIAIVLTAVALVQRIIFCQNNDRPLTKAERAMLAVVFENSLSLYNIRLIQGWSGLFGITTSGAWTLCNTIYLNSTDLSVTPETLVHECVHVWQYQNRGTRYLMDAAGAMLRYGRTGAPGDAYDWTAEPGRGHFKWEDFNREAQAELIQDVWTDGALDRGGTLSTGSGAFFELQNCEAASGPDFCTENFVASRDGADHTKLADEATAALRGAWNFRFSRNF